MWAKSIICVLINCCDQMNIILQSIINLMLHAENALFKIPFFNKKDHLFRASKTKDKIIYDNFVKNTHIKKTINEKYYFLGLRNWKRKYKYANINPSNYIFTTIKKDSEHWGKITWFFYTLLTPVVMHNIASTSNPNWNHTYFFI